MQHKYGALLMTSLVSKQMVYAVYGNYVEGLEKDGERIVEYFGRDFCFTQKNKFPVTYGYSAGTFLKGLS